MPETETFNDGELEHGSSILTITPKQDADPARAILTDFEAIGDNQFSFSESARVIDQTGQFGQPIKQFGIPEKRQGSCTVQLPTGRRAFRGDTFVCDAETDAAVGITFIVTSADHVYVKDGYRQQTIGFVERLNAP